MSVTAILKPTLESFATHVNTESFGHEQQSSSTMTEGTSSSTEDNRFSFFQRIKQEKLSNIRPLNEFFDKNRFNYTTSFQLISQRWK